MEEDKNYIHMIHGDLARASQVQSGMPENVGVMNIKSANRTILEASQKPTPRSLWDCFWYEGELSCLFADSNVGKSILAVQIADRIARTDNVLYLDFELSDRIVCLVNIRSNMQWQTEISPKVPNMQNRRRLLHVGQPSCELTIKRL